MKIAANLFFLFLLTACSPSIISFYVIDENNISFESFSFYEPETKHVKPQQISIDSLIENSIATELVRKGYKFESTSDVYISFRITTGSSSTTNVDNRNYQNHQTYQRYNTQNYYPYNNTTTNYKEGVLLIELWSKDDKLLWQGSKSFKVRKSIDTKELLITYAKEIMASFKPNL